MTCKCCVIIQSSGGAYKVRTHQQVLLPEVKAPHLCDTSDHQRLIKRVPPGHSQIRAFCVAVLLNHWDSFTSAVRTGVLLLSVCKKTIFRLSKNKKIIQGERSAKWCFHLTQQTFQTNQALGSPGVIFDILFSISLFVLFFSRLMLFC